MWQFLEFSYLRLVGRKGDNTKTAIYMYLQIVIIIMIIIIFKNTETILEGNLKALKILRMSLKLFSK